MKVEHIKSIAGHALGSIDSILSRWLPGGKREGREYLPINPTRADSKPGSFSINLNTGSWSDFATGDKGLDLVSLVAYLEGVSQGRAAGKLADYLGIQLDKKTDSRERAVSDSKASTKGNALPKNGINQGGGNGDGWECVMPMPDNAPKPPDAHPKHGKPSSRYAYLAADGRINFYHDRYEPNQPDQKKQFSPLTLWQKGSQFKWQFKAPPVPRPLYGLPGLREYPDAVVWIAEGEKAVAALESLLPGSPVLCWQGGSQAIEKSDFSSLLNRNCIIFPDNDHAGKKAAGDLVRKIKAVNAKTVRVLDVDKLALSPGYEGEGINRQAILIYGEPLNNGDDAADMVARGWKAEHFALFLQDDVLLPDEALEPKSDSKNSKPENEPIQSNFELFGKGVFHLKQSEDGRFNRRWICSPIEVLARSRTLDNKEWGLLVKFNDPDGKIKRLVLPMRSFNGDGLQATGELLDAGLSIATGARKLVLEYLQSVNPEKRARTTNRTGWHGEADEMAFVFPDVAIGQRQEEWLYSNQAPDTNPFKQRGTLKQWQENVAALCAGNSRLVFAVSAAFASPLLYLVGTESGGLYFRGISSSGKTTALHVAASVCGSKDYMQTFRATDNGLENLALSRCDALLLLDELKQIEPRVAAEAIYMLGNGAPKFRQNQNGGGRSHATWRVLFFGAGEMSLSQHVADAGKRVHAGAEIRFCDIPADAGEGMGCFENLHGFDLPGKFSDVLAANAAKFMVSRYWNL